MKLLVAVDFSDSTKQIIENAKSISKADDSKIWLIHVAVPEPAFVGYGIGPQTVRDSVAKEFHEEHKMLQQLSEELREAGIDCVALLVQGTTVDAILHEAEKLSVDLIVLGTHGKSALMKILLGSTSEGVLHRSTIPLLMIPTHKKN